MRIELNGRGAGAARRQQRSRMPCARAAPIGRFAASRSRSTARSSRATDWQTTPLTEGGAVEVLAAIQGGADGWELGGREWSSRLIAGSGGFRSLEQMESALAACRRRDRHCRPAPHRPRR